MKRPTRKFDNLTIENEAEISEIPPSNMVLPPKVPVETPSFSA